MLSEMTRRGVNYTPIFFPCRTKGGKKCSAQARNKMDLSGSQRFIRPLYFPAPLLPPAFFHAPCTPSPPSFPLLQILPFLVSPSPASAIPLVTSFLHFAILPACPLFSSYMLSFLYPFYPTFAIHPEHFFPVSTIHSAPFLIFPLFLLFPTISFPSQPVVFLLPTSMFSMYVFASIYIPSRFLHFLFDFLPLSIPSSLHGIQVWTHFKPSVRAIFILRLAGKSMRLFHISFCSTYCFPITVNLQTVPHCCIFYWFC